MPRVRALASTRAGDADPLERARLKFPTAAIAVPEFTRTWQELGPERARLTTSVGAVMHDIRRSARRDWLTGWHPWRT
jgi:phosphohistidine phosphatase SixA